MSRRVEFTASGKPVVHGRTTSYQRHKCRCDECTEAERLRSRADRAKNPKRRHAERAQANAYSRAAAILRERHRAEFDAIYQAEQREVDAGRYAHPSEPTVDPTAALLEQLETEALMGDPKPWKNYVA